MHSCEVITVMQENWGGGCHLKHDSGILCFLAGNFSLDSVSRNKKEKKKA